MNIFRKSCKKREKAKQVYNKLFQLDSCPDCFSYNFSPDIIVVDLLTVSKGLSCNRCDDCGTKWIRDAKGGHLTAYEGGTRSRRKGWWKVWER